MSIMMKQLIAASCLLLLSTAQQRPVGKGGGAGGAGGGVDEGTICDLSGADATYAETIISDSSANGGEIRQIEASGCPNHLSMTIGDNPNDAEPQDYSIQIPAYPCFSDKGDYDITCIGNGIGITLSGIVFFSKYDGAGCGNDAVQLEGDTFDSCSGHSAGGGVYHYHIAPSCLLKQMDDYEGTTQHSPQIGWAYDGFPVYGPHGGNGQDIYPCTHSSANSTDCLDSCGGHSQHQMDGFGYHYHVIGPVGDLTSIPVHPLPGTDMSPYTLGCLKGVPLDWDIIGESDNGASCSADGTTSDYVPAATQGVTTPFSADDITTTDGSRLLNINNR